MSTLVKYLLNVFSQRTPPPSPSETSSSLVKSASTPQLPTANTHPSMEALDRYFKRRRSTSATYTSHDQSAFAKPLGFTPRSPPAPNLKSAIADPRVSLDPAATTTPIRHGGEQKTTSDANVSTPSSPNTPLDPNSTFDISLISDVSTSTSFSDDLLVSPSPTSPFLPVSVHRYRDSISYRSPPAASRKSSPSPPLTPIGLGISNLPRKDGKTGSFDGLGVVGIRSSGRRYHYQTQSYTPGPRVPASWRHGFIGSIQEEDEEADEDNIDVIASPIMGGLPATQFGPRLDGESLRQGYGGPSPARSGQTQRSRRRAGLSLSRTFLQELMQTWTTEDPFKHSDSSCRTLASIPEQDGEDLDSEASEGASGGFEDISLDDDREGPSATAPSSSCTPPDDNEAPATPNRILRAILAFTPKMPSPVRFPDNHQQDSEMGPFPPTPSTIPRRALRNRSVSAPDAPNVHSRQERRRSLPQPYTAKIGNEAAREQSSPSKNTRIRLLTGSPRLGRP